MRSLRLAALAALVLLGLAGPSAAQGPVRTPRVHALTGARIQIAPGRVLERGTVILRDGVIEAVGAKVSIPADARIWKLDSLTVYPGLVDLAMPVTPAGVGGGERASGERPRGEEPAAARAGTPHELDVVTPELVLADRLELSKEDREARRAQGITTVRAIPGKGVFRGQAAVVDLGDGDLGRNLLRRSAGQVLSFSTAPGDKYPTSVMGTVAVLRQTILDARWYASAHAAYAAHPAGIERPPVNTAWESLSRSLEDRDPLVFVTDDALDVLRAKELEREFGLSFSYVGSGEEYKRLAEMLPLPEGIVVPVNYPEPPSVDDPGAALAVSLETLRHWDAAPANPARLHAAKVRFALTAAGLKDVSRFRKNVAKAVAAGLPAEAALAAATTVPASMIGMSDRLGTVEAGKIANLVVTDGPLFADSTKVRAVWVDGNRYEVEEVKPPQGDPRGTWEMTAVLEGRSYPFTLVVGGEPGALTGTARMMGQDVAASVSQSGSTVTATYPGDAMGLPGTIRFSFSFRGESALGSGSSPVGDFSLSGTRTAKPAGAPSPGPGATAEVTATVSTSVTAAPARPSSGPAASAPSASMARASTLDDPEPWRVPRPDQPAAVLVRNATVWTSGPQGKLENADLLVERGKIVRVGRGLAAPRGAVVIDGTGRHVTPGIIDAHSHSAIVGDVNEGTHNITAEVRIQDVVNSETTDLYRQLAGGVTCINVFHGSANAIGGQNCVIKLRRGEGPEGLKLEGAKPGIKFALGENPKQSNWGERYNTRYPQTRAGVAELIRERFLAARDYMKEEEDFRRGRRRGIPPRRDLQLEAVAEILRGERLVHSHAYRADEMLMLMRTAEEFGFRVGSFQHVLEGYKVADEIAAHGAGASGFSDWWAYKFEVYDAIPYNGAILWDRGVTTSFNSDSDELARRLNLEAAKAVKYGGVPEEDALEFVTLNPAKHLDIDARVGSLEPGKDADFAIWSGSPLSVYSVCDETWVDGRKYFDRAQDLAGRAVLAAERDSLVAKVKKAKAGDKGKGEGGGSGYRRPKYQDDGHVHRGCYCIKEEFLSEEGGR